MDLILWRHAEAEYTTPDMDRALTEKGRTQAKMMAEWLHAHMPKDTVVMASPARRAQQTAQALDCAFKTVEGIAPDAEAGSVLVAANWPNSPENVLIVGHQPTLGRATSLLLFGEERSFSLKKGGVIWISHRQRIGEPEVTLKAAITPAMLK